MSEKTSPDMLMRIALLGLALTLAAPAARAEIRRDPNGVNVNAQGATTVFITFGGLDQQIPVEATWCGELIPATPDVGFKCDPATLFGRLPLRYDQSALSGTQTVFTDIMSIPPSVSRRAYQAAERGEASAFFYVRRFQSLVGGPDEYVFVTCRMAGGGARVPLALLDVQIAYDDGANVASVNAGRKPPAFAARISYNGTGRLKGRWEVVVPGEDLPTSRDLLTEATLPIEERGLQRRYAQLSRFNVFLPPTGTYTLPGPDLSRLPTTNEGLYLILLRIEASADKEGDSNLGNAGAGQGVIHSGAVAGFPMPVLRYFVGGAENVRVTGDRLALLAPAPDASIVAGRDVVFTWVEGPGVAAYRLEVEDPDGASLLAAMLPPGVAVYRAPSWLRERATSGEVRWRVRALGPTGEAVGETGWRRLVLAGS